MRSYVAGLIIAALLFVSPATAFQSNEPSDPQFRVHRSVDDAKRDAKREQAMNKDRAARIKRDTDKLFQLATELKQYVDKTNENVMSVQVIKKAEEVEKLAKTIKDKMKEDYHIPDTALP